MDRNFVLVLKMGVGYLLLGSFLALNRSDNTLKNFYSCANALKSSDVGPKLSIRLSKSKNAKFYT